MTRVAVIGNAGGGKSTLSRALSRARSLPYIAVDRMQWLPGWVAAPDEAFRAAHDAVLAREAWIIDGFGPWESVEKRFDAADTIVVVDLPFARHLWWAAKRQLVSVVRGREDGPPGCPMFPVTFRMFRMMWWIHREQRPKLLAAIATRRMNKSVFHLRSVRELAAFEAHFC